MMKAFLVLAFVAAALCDNSTTTMAPASSAGPSMMCPGCKNMTEIKAFYDDYSTLLFGANVVVALQKADLFSQALPLYKRSLCYEVSLSNMTYKMIKTDNIVAKCELISFMTPTMSPTTTMASATTSNETMTTTTMNSTTTVAATTEDANTTMSTDGNSTTAMPGNDTTAMPTTTMMAANTTTTMATPAPETGTMAHITGVIFYIKDSLKTMYAHNYTCGEHNNETCEGFYISSVSMNKSILPPIPGKEVMDKIVSVNIVQPQSFNFSTIANFSALLTVEIMFAMLVPKSSKCIMFDGTPNIKYCTTILNGRSIRCKCEKLGIIGVAYDTPPPTTSSPTTTPVATTVNVNANTTATPTNSTASSMMNTTVQVNTTVSMNVTMTKSTTETTVLPPTTPDGGSLSKMEILFSGNYSAFDITSPSFLNSSYHALYNLFKANYPSTFVDIEQLVAKHGSIIYNFFLILKDASTANTTVNAIGHQVKNSGFVLNINGETLTADANGFKVDGQQYVVYATDPPTQPEEDDNDYIIVIIVVTIILVLGIIIIIVVVYIVRDKSKQKVKPDSRKN